ncbi:hypothetical protein [Scytonema sp. NUACC26]|uniref:hypothetical protein n=1 Tax=Scytonema sp. NUACC26 TaxID=3140176 RepID=UPI0034DB7D1E
MNHYSFAEYSADIERSLAGKHSTTAYKCLGLIGELGELVTELIDTVISDATSEIEVEVLAKLEAFVQLASQIEKLKKQIRSNQVEIFVDEIIPQNGHNAEKLKEELGGVLWYLDTLASLLKTSLGQVAYENQELLQRRFSLNPNWIVDNSKVVE